MEQKGGDICIYIDTYDVEPDEILEFHFVCDLKILVCKNAANPALKQISFFARKN